MRAIKENKCLSKTENAIYKKENVQNCENLNLNVKYFIFSLKKCILLVSTNSKLFKDG